MTRCILGEALLDWESIRVSALDHFPTYCAFIDRWERQIAASGIAARSGETVEQGSTEGKSPVAKPDAQDPC